MYKRSLFDIIELTNNTVGQDGKEEVKMESKFTVKSIEKAQKHGYVVVNVTYPTGKTYNYVRKAYTQSGV